jgi:hypothetical protein
LLAQAQLWWVPLMLWTRATSARNHVALHLYRSLFGIPLWVCPREGKGKKGEWGGGRPCEHNLRLHMQHARTSGSDKQNAIMLCMEPDPLKHPIPCCSHVALKLTVGWAGQQNSFHLLLKLEHPRSRSNEAKNLNLHFPSFPFQKNS